MNAERRRGVPWRRLIEKATLGRKIEQEEKVHHQKAETRWSETDQYMTKTKEGKCAGEKTLRKKKKRQYTYEQIMMNRKQWTDSFYPFSRKLEGRVFCSVRNKACGRPAHGLRGSQHRLYSPNLRGAASKLSVTRTRKKKKEFPLALVTFQGDSVQNIRE